VFWPPGVRRSSRVIEPVRPVKSPQAAGAGGSFETIQPFRGGACLARLRQAGDAIIRRAAVPRDMRFWCLLLYKAARSAVGMCFGMFTTVYKAARSAAGIFRGCSLPYVRRREAPPEIFLGMFATTCKAARSAAGKMGLAVHFTRFPFEKSKIGGIRMRNESQHLITRCTAQLGACGIKGVGGPACRRIAPPIAPEGGGEGGGVPQPGQAAPGRRCHHPEGCCPMRNLLKYDFSNFHVKK